MIFSWPCSYHSTELYLYTTHYLIKRKQKATRMVGVKMRSAFAIQSTPNSTTMSFSNPFWRVMPSQMDGQFTCQRHSNQFLVQSQFTPAAPVTGMEAHLTLGADTRISSGPRLSRGSTKIEKKLTSWRDKVNWAVHLLIFQRVRNKWKNTTIVLIFKFTSNLSRFNLGRFNTVQLTENKADSK